MARVEWTSRVLLAGSLLAAVFFAVGFALHFVLESNLATTAAMAGVLTMLATPVVGLVATAIELREGQREATLLAVGVMAVLAVAVAVAILAR
jgi:hypothetical protein